MDLVPCVHCRRHVGVSETTCPFCARTVSPQRPQFAFAGRLTRAAIFSAAVVGCDSKSTSKPAPAPEQHEHGSAAGSGSDDLEKMLDSDGHVVDHPAAVDAAVPDGAAVAEAADAGGPSDAGVLTTSMIKQRAKELERLRMQKDRKRQEDLERNNIRIQVNNKPYGAPPARRRVV